MGRGKGNKQKTTQQTYADTLKPPTSPGAANTPSQLSRNQDTNPRTNLESEADIARDFRPTNKQPDMNEQSPSRPTNNLTAQQTDDQQHQAPIGNKDDEEFVYNVE